jgi:hypothetical protein
MKKQKDLLIAPLVMIVAKLPLLLISLAIRCISEQWHLYFSLVAYSVSLLPLTSTFVIFIWPSSTFMQIFQTYTARYKRTNLKQNILKKRQKTNKARDIRLWTDYVHL